MRFFQHKKSFYFYIYDFNFVFLFTLIKWKHFFIFGFYEKRVSRVVLTFNGFVEELKIKFKELFGGFCRECFSTDF